MHAAMMAAAVLLSAVLAAPPLAAQTGAPATPTAQVTDAELEAQTRAVASQLRCVVCQGLSIQDSPSSLAQEMRGLVREQLAAGRTPAQVKQYFVEKYGEFVLLEPTAKGFNLLVYVLPVVVLLGGAAFVFMKARQWTRRPEPIPVDE